MAKRPVKEKRVVKEKRPAPHQSSGARTIGARSRARGAADARPATPASDAAAAATTSATQARPARVGASLATGRSRDAQGGQASGDADTVSASGSASASASAAASTSASSSASASASTRAPRAARKPAYHHGDLRAALVDAAAQLAAEVGPSAVTLREVARRAGVSQAAPYHHFADKQALIAAVAEEGFNLFDAHQEASLVETSQGTPAERLAALGASYVRFAFAHPNYFRVMFRPYLFEGPRTPEFEAVARRAFDRLVETTRAARDAAGRHDSDPMAASMALWAMPHGLAVLALDSPNAKDLSPGLTEQLVRAAVVALAAMPLDLTPDAADLRKAAEVCVPAPSPAQTPSASGASASPAIASTTTTAPTPASTARLAWQESRRS